MSINQEELEMGVTKRKAQSEQLLTDGKNRERKNHLNLKYFKSF